MARGPADKSLFEDCEAAGVTGAGEAADEGADAVCCAGASVAGPCKSTFYNTLFSRQGRVYSVLETDLGRSMSVDPGRGLLPQQSGVSKEESVSSIRFRTMISM